MAKEWHEYFGEVDLKEGLNFQGKLEISIRGKFTFSNMEQLQDFEEVFNDAMERLYQEGVHGLEYSVKFGVEQ